MKKIIFITMCLMALTLFHADAKIWRVNNTGLPAYFTTLQQAHDSAAVQAGDTLHLESSLTSYGSLDATKKLIILGPGYFLTQNLNNQFNQDGAQADNITFDIGSEGSVISGVTVNNNISINAGSISVIRNYVEGMVWITGDAGVTNSFSNTSILQNYIGGEIVSAGGTGTYSNIILSNNLVEESIDLPSNFTGIITNNIITNLSNGDLSAYGSTIQNNIAAGTIYVGAGDNITYNLYGTGSLPATNQTITNWATLFVDTVSTDASWELATGSQAIGAGAAGADCGIFGGSTPYHLSGLPDIPSIYYLSAPAMSSGNTLPVTISVKSNN
jgi:hypothetical protein